jgi:Cu2+-exporting ATPase
VQRETTTLKLSTAALRCRSEIEARLAAIPGVLEVSVQPLAGLVTVTYDPAQLDPPTLEDALRRSADECGAQHGEHGPEAAGGQGPQAADGHGRGAVRGQGPQALAARAAQAHPASEHERHEMEAAGGDHAQMERDIRRRFLVSAVLTVPVLILSPTVQQFFGLQLPVFPGDELLLLGLASVIVLYGGWPFYVGAVHSLGRARADMNVLITVAVGAGYLFSVASIFAFEGVDFFWEISTLVVVLLFGHWLEMRAVGATSGALRELARLIPPTANVVQDDRVATVPTAEVQVGDRLLVRPGERVPIDGRVYEGRSEVNEALVTGESRPVPKQPGDEVIGGSINGEGALRIEVTKTGEETALAQIMALVQSAQASKPRTQRLADRAATYLTLIAVSLGLGTFLFWLLLAGRPFVFALTLAITVVVIACPHALGLAIPTVTTISTSLAARNGILIRNADATEAARRLDTIVFDKTGTLTRGEFGVSDVVPLGGWTAAQALARAAAVEQSSEHSIARGIVRAAREGGLELPEARDFAAIPGQGVRALVAGEEVLVGNRALMAGRGVPLQAAERALAGREQGRTWAYVATGGQVRAVIGLTDVIRDESRQAVDGLKAMGLQVAMLTGDSAEVAAYVAGELGLDTYFAEVQPGEKAGKVRALQEEGRVVGMVGDGINDAPALVQADVGIAIGAGTDVAIESAEVVLVRNDPRDVIKLVRLSRAVGAKMQQNLVWATGYNVVALPLAAGVGVPAGIVLAPQYGALAMAGSTVIVAVNALLLRRLDLG